MCSCRDAVADTAHRFVVAAAFNWRCHDDFSIAQPCVAVFAVATG